jgi:hypothetical protein
MVLVLAASVGVNQKRELSAELVSILLSHERHHELIVVHGNEHTPFSCVSCERILKGKGDSRRGNRKWCRVEEGRTLFVT